MLITAQHLHGAGSALLDCWTAAPTEPVTLHTTSAQSTLHNRSGCCNSQPSCLTCSCLPLPWPGSQWHARQPPAPRMPRPAAACARRQTQQLSGSSSRRSPSTTVAAAQLHTFQMAALPATCNAHLGHPTQRRLTACRSTGKVRRLLLLSSILLISCFSAPCTGRSRQGCKS